MYLSVSAAVGHDGRHGRAASVYGNGSPEKYETEEDKHPEKERERVAGRDRDTGTGTRRGQTGA